MKSQREVRLLNKDEYETYQSFVKNHPDALYLHGLEIMDLIVHHFRFSPSYLVAWVDGSIRGVLPLFKTSSLVEGVRYVSIPFFPFGGVVSDDDEVTKMLLEKAKELAQDGKFLEIRQQKPLKEDLVSHFVKQSPITDFLIDLRSSEEEMLASFSKDVRYDIRKAQKNGLIVVIGTEKKRLDDFYNVYLNTRKRRGVPAWPYTLFEEALRTCTTTIAVTYLGEKPIAAAFLFFDRETIEYAFAGTDYCYNKISPYYILLWEIICYGITQKYAIVDLGGSTREMNDGNMYAFKEKWATRQREIPYYFYAADSKDIPSLDASFGLYRLYGKVWRLLPKKMIEVISPIVIRQFK
ncbi:peptidoglycan bridge formation glycyltransferase FemA/FemB family protein [Candidatus Woesearchaeota archaeon]|nr:peptidoglycan bridge formation glycyltransferase FemA/FemB family protein [Candidatus Woesearchaeota archaeon]